MAESVPIDQILKHAEAFAQKRTNEDNASHLSRLLKLAAGLPVYSGHQTDSHFAERLGLCFTLYKTLESYLAATLPKEILDI